MSKKGPRTLRQARWQLGPNTVETSTTPPLPYLLITVKASELEKTFLVICKGIRLFVNTLTADDKCFLLNRDNSRQPIQMELSKKQKTFSEFFSAILKSRLNFKQLKKKMTLIADVFPKLGTRKTWLNKSLKSHVSEDPSTTNMVRGTKHC